MSNKQTVIELERVVIKFSGDSGDGMQLTGTQFSETSALMGNEVSTFPDYPAEIRAPQGTVGGVSGFQLNFGNMNINTPGDYADVLVAMNPAALVANLRWIKQGGTIILDIDMFNEKNLEKAGCTENPLENNQLENFHVIPAPITSLTKEALKELDLDVKSVLRTKNMFALGMVYWLFSRELDYTENFFEKKFKKVPLIVEANKLALNAGYNFALNLQLMRSYRIVKGNIEKGTYRNISGNVATAWGLLAAAEKSGLQLFLGSYPITPATEILQEIAARKDMGAISFQAEDEIAGIVTSIGAAFAGKFACTSTSGPGLALKSEAIGLAVITELPIVIVNVQRGGPSTGLPTKTEQSDLLQALYGRNGESPCVVIAASTPSNCFHYAFEAGRIALENMTPVILLTDGFLANGSHPWKFPKMSDLPTIKTRIIKEDTEKYLPYKRIEGTTIREWAIPGMKGFEHRIGGLEKMAITGTVSYVPENHEVMTQERERKVQEIAYQIPEQTIDGDSTGDVLVVGWGGTYGHLLSAITEIREENIKVSYTHFNYINPLPKNTAEIFSGFKKIIIFEINDGQFYKYLKSKLPQFNYLRYNKIQGLPFTIVEVKEFVIKNMED